ITSPTFVLDCSDSSYFFITSTTLVFLYYSFVTSFFFHDPATTEIYTLSLHDALPIWCRQPSCSRWRSKLARMRAAYPGVRRSRRSEEHTSELQSRVDLVCRLLLEKKNKDKSREHGV